MMHTKTMLFAALLGCWGCAAPVRPTPMPPPVPKECQDLAITAFRIAELRDQGESKNVMLQKLTNPETATEILQRLFAWLVPFVYAHPELTPRAMEDVAERACMDYLHQRQLGPAP